jgi:hypothetical protein
MDLTIEEMLLTIAHMIGRYLVALLEFGLHVSWCWKEGHEVQIALSYGGYPMGGDGHELERVMYGYNSNGMVMVPRL